MGLIFSIENATLARENLAMAPNPHYLPVFTRPEASISTTHPSVIYSLDDCSPGTLVQVIQGLHILSVELEAEDVSISLNPAGRVALGQRDPVLLQTVAD